MSTYKIGPVQQRTFVMGLRLTQIVSLVVAIFGGLIMVQVLPGQIGIGAAVLLIAACLGMTFAYVGGRPVDAWIPALYKFTLTTFGRKRRFISTAPHVGVVVGEGEVDPESPVRKGGHAAPPPNLSGVKILKVSLANGSEIGIIKDTKLGTYAGVLQLSGQAFGLLDESEQEQKLSSWGGVLSSCAREASPIHRLQWIERTLPEVGDAMANYYKTASVLPEDHPLSSAYAELVDSAGPVTQQHQLYLVVQIHARKAARTIRKQGGGDQGATEVLMRELHNVEALLDNADINVVGTLNSREVSMLFRTAFDPGAVNMLTARGATNPELRGSLPRNAWPMATEENWANYRTDNILHSSFWIAEWPRMDAPGDFFAPVILSTRATRTISLTMEPISPSRAVRLAESAHTSFVADEDLRQKAGYMHTARREREYDNVVRREQELADGHALYRFSGFVTVSSTDEEALEYAASDVEQAAYQSRLELRPCYGEQAIAFACTLPLARGLR